MAADIMDTARVISREVVVGLENGLHLAPASEIVQLSKRFGCELSLRKGDRVADGTSMIDLLTLAVEHGQTLQLEVRGERASEAMDALLLLVDGGSSTRNGPSTSNS